ncbi:MAG: glycogen debranching enzyme N-terminal domain-containing protein, partial [Ktedonobacteraceae bacterium]|nr:glycogen debranching enzyme N-terminal domain-containing protein [Ktedonobacteraceae bacterium]
MPISFDRSICCDLSETITREWLITNGLGGYAAGTVVGALTRMQHGLLVASPLETTAPQLLLAKIDEEVLFDQRTYYLGTNEYRDGTLNPSGFGHLETFRLEEGLPVFTYRLGGIDGIVLEKRIWMPYGSNTTCIQYRVFPGPTRHEAADRGGWQGSGRASSAHQTHTRYHGYSEAVQRALELTLLPFSAYRPHHLPQYGNNDWHFQVEAHQAGHHPPEQAQRQQMALPQGVAGCTIHAWEGAHPYHIFVAGHPESHTTFIPTGVWYWHFLRRQDAAAGLTAIDDLYLPGVFKARLWPGEDAALTMIATAEEVSSLTFSPGQLTSSYKRSVERQRGLLHPQRYFGEGGESAYHLCV